MKTHAGIMTKQHIVLDGRAAGYNYVDIKLAVGAGIMLLAAALLEGYWSPSAISSWIKFTVGLTGWVFVYAWLFLSGWGATE